jgi:hypothetical protein
MYNNCQLGIVSSVLWCESAIALRVMLPFYFITSFIINNKLVI